MNKTKEGELSTKYLLLLKPFYKEFYESYGGDEIIFAGQLALKYNIPIHDVNLIMNKIIFILKSDVNYSYQRNLRYQKRHTLYVIAQKVLSEYVCYKLPNPPAGYLENDSPTLAFLQARTFGDFDKIKSDKDKAYWKQMLTSMQSPVTHDEQIKYCFKAENFDITERVIVRKIFPYLLESERFDDIVEDLEIQPDVATMTMKKFFHYAWQTAQNCNIEDIVDYGYRINGLSIARIRRLMHEQLDFWYLIVSELKYRM